MAALASLCRLQNCLQLVKELRLSARIDFKVYTRPPSAHEHRYLIIVHVKADSAFPKYFQHASRADLVLFRGMFLNVTLTEPLAAVLQQPRDALPKIANVSVQQTFLPKFENEGQDADIAQAIQNGANDLFMAVTIKHSGSLVTLSHELMGAKNSIGNIFTSVGVLLLHAHYTRVACVGAGDADALLQQLLQSLEAERTSLSFELVARCLGHHGQLPAAEYLVCTSVARTTVDGRVQVLPWEEQLRFCARHRLPVNDSWLFPTATLAAQARSLLDGAATSATPTAEVVAALDGLAVGAAGAVHVPGTYPHAEWQGSRIEGFVVAQGSPVCEERSQALRELAGQLQAQVLHTDDVAATPAGRDSLRLGEAAASGAGVDLTSVATNDALEAALGGTPADKDERVRKQVHAVAPHIAHLQGNWVAVPKRDAHALVELLRDVELPETDDVFVNGESGSRVPSRQALGKCSAEQLAALTAAVEAGSSGGPVPKAPRSISDAMRVLSGALSADKGLRYKKKMWLFRLPDAAAPGHVGYCMMTFVVRNGLRELQRGRPEYLGYVQALGRRWGFSPPQQKRLQHFALCWARWAGERGLVSDLKQSNYLEAAEAFVADFLGGEGSEVGSFRGAVLLAGFDEATVQAVKRQSNILDSGRPQRWSPALAEFGYLLDASLAQQRQLDYAWQKVVPDLKVVVSPAARSSLADSALLAAVREHCARTAVPVTERIMELPGPTAAPVGGGRKGKGRHQQHGGGGGGPGAQHASGGEEAVRRICDWLGAGTPQPTRDPSCIVVFASIPGVGKTVLSDLLEAHAAERGTHAVIHHHSDALPKAQQRGFAYWQAVADQAVTFRGDGRATVVLADKNLIDNPPGNLQQTASILSAAGSKVLAVFLTDTDNASAAAADAVGSQHPPEAEPADQLPAHPFSMQLLALSMLRVFSRNNHEGGLDRRLPDALSIVAGFAGSYRGNSVAAMQRKLHDLFCNVLVLPVMRPAAPENSPPKLAHLLDDVGVGFRRGGFRAGKGPPPLGKSWETRMREVLTDDGLAAFLNGRALPLEAEVDTMVAKIEDALAAGSELDEATAARSACTYVALTELDVAALGSAFAAAQEGRREVRAPKKELHSTLWHRANSEGPEHWEFGHSLMALDGQSAAVAVVGFDVSERCAAARLEFVEGPAEVASVERLHVTMWVAQGVPAKEAGFLAQRHQEGDPGVEFLPLPEPIRVDGVIQMVQQKAPAGRR